MFLYINFVAPTITKLISTALKEYTISWIQPVIPIRQRVLAFYASYNTLEGVGKTFNLSRERKSITIDVKFSKQYMFEIQVETNAGRSDMASKSWFSHSGMLYLYLHVFSSLFLCVSTLRIL